MAHAMNPPWAAPARAKDGPVALHDYWTPTLQAAMYSIAVQQELTGDKGVEGTFEAPARTFEVVAPRFTLDPALVHATCPVPGAAGDFSCVLPHISLTGPTLPWERSPNAEAGKTTPWLALLVLTAAELPPDPGTGETDRERAIAELTPDKKTDVPAGVLIPALSKEAVTVGPDRCRTIDLRAEVFTAVVPRLDELPCLTHVRRAVAPGPGPEPRPDDVSVVLSNRLPRTPGSYAAHLVSLEGLGDWLTTLPDKDTRGENPVTTVRLVSLRSWTFEATAETHPGFATVASALRDSSGDKPLLRLGVPWNGPDAPDPASEPGPWRLRQGYVPLRHRLPTGERTYAWYRGPFTPVVPARLPGGVEALDSEAAALIHLPAQNMFDVSYASAFALGKVLALAYADLPATLGQLSALGLETIARFPDGSGAAEPSAPDAAGPVALSALRVDGTARRAFEAALTGEAADSAAQESRAAAPPDLAARLSAALFPVPGSAVASAYDQAVAVTLGALDDSGVSLNRLLAAVPFAHLVPHEGLLPPETVRFFHLDASWVHAVAAGLLSLGIRTSLDKKLIGRTLEALTAAETLPVAGMLVRSTLVRDWPGLIFEARAGGTDVLVGAPHVPAPDLALVLFSAVPDTVRLRQPAQALQFGLDGKDFIVLRYLVPDRAGESMGDLVRLTQVDTHLRTPPAGLPREVFDTGRLVAALRDALAANGQWPQEQPPKPLSPVAAALQLVNTPGELVFAAPKILAGTSPQEKNAE
ncbi:hypothetical protein [Streptomyces sp. NBC_01477]|uniref:hypothetical protein n=1 Tax=Streptomyces sp. NBC_01477 TaxID=2976015 RepID=UPI002E309435|nr:hypothetical protein [Streptomyces sp. NBC_01477]